MTLFDFWSVCVVFQVSVSAEHQEFFVFLQRLLSPVLEAYSGAAIFVHSLSQPMVESDYTQRLFRYLLTRTERGVAGYGNILISPTYCTMYLKNNLKLLYIALGIEKIAKNEKMVFPVMIFFFRCWE